MDFIAAPYFKSTRIILTAIGIWPYTKPSLFQTLHKSLLLFVFVQVIIAQLCTCVTSTCNSEHLLKIFPYFMVSCAFTIKYITFVVQKDKLKVAFDVLQEHWRSLESEEEVRIMLHYADISQAYVKLFACKRKLKSLNAPRKSLPDQWNLRVILWLLSVCLYVASGATLASQFTPFILNVFGPRNASRSFEPIAHLEYFIDTDKYGYVTALSMSAVVILGSMTIVGTESVIILFSYHACSLLKIMEHRLTNVFQVDDTNKGFRSDSETFAKAVGIVIAHTNTIKFVQHVLSCVGMSYFILIMTGVGALTASLFRLRQAIVLSYETLEIAVSFSKIVVDLIYMFYGNFIGQEMMDVTTRMFDNMYASPWYKAPLPVQKLLLLAMQQGTQNMDFVIGGIFTASYEGFSMLVRTSLSYFTFICSRR